MAYEQVGLSVEYDLETSLGTKLGLSRDQVSILRKCRTAKKMQDLASQLGRSNRTKFRDQVVKPLMTLGLVEMTVPDKPNSPNQQYETTRQGVKVLAAIEADKS